MRILFLLIFLNFKVLYAQTVPAQFISDWASSGIEGTFFEPSNLVSILNFGGVPGDGISDHSALTAAMNSLNGPGVVYFPPGIYNFDAPVFLRDSIILRGAGADSTDFVFDLNNVAANCINASGSVQPSFIPLNGGYHFRSSALILSGADTLFAAGDYIEMRQENGAWDTNPVFWADFSVGHLSKVNAVSGDTIFLNDPLRINFDAALIPEIRKIFPLHNAGLECFRLSRTDSLAPGLNYAMWFYYSWNCRLKGVESFKSIGAHVAGESSAHLLIRDSYFHEAYTYDGNNTRGYGIIVAIHSTSCRIENSIFRRLRHAMMIKQGANGNVFGYNYSLEPFRPEFPSDAGGDISGHGHYAFANLFEGNVCQNLIIDDAWGPTGPRNAFFRNRAERYGIIINSGTVQSDSQVVAGNTVSSLAPFTGFYILNGSGHFTHGNTVQGNLNPPGTGTLPDSSLYLPGVPDFWLQGIGFPAIGTGSSGSETNPAKERFGAGTEEALCNPVSTGIDEIVSPQILQVYYDGSFLNAYCPGTPDGLYQVTVLSLNGQYLFRGEAFVKDHQLRIGKFLQPGIYFLRMMNERTMLQGKFITSFNP